MTIIHHRRGARRVYSFDPEDENGLPVDAEGVTGELRVRVADTCIAVPMLEGLDVDLQPLDLPAAEYLASVYLDWGHGLEFEGELVIKISEGC